MNQIKNLFSSNRDHLQFFLLLLGGLILFFYSAILTFAPVIRTLSWQSPLNWKHWIAFVVWVIISVITHKYSSKVLPNRDPYLIPIIYMLVGVGLLTLFRLSIAFGWRQLIWFSLGSIILIIGEKFPRLLIILRRYKYLWLFLGLIATILTLFFGIYPGGDGPELWLGCCGIYFQPSEPLKLLFIVYLSAFFADNWALKKNLSIILVPSFIMVTVATMVLFSQRDLGTASIFLIIYALYLFILTGKKRIILIFLVIVLIAGFLGYQYIDLIKIRIDGWLNPWLDPSGGSYQIIQSLQALASGHLIGTGPGLGSPGLVPVAISDFIFSAIIEELGLVGGLFIISLYFMLAYRGFLISLKSQNHFHKLLAFGISAFISFQSILIIGGNIRLLPLTGVTLPFISYGGSSLLTVFIAALFLILISQFQSAKSIEEKDEKPYYITYYIVLAGFSCLILLTFFWSIINSNNLINRPDNLRKIINDRFVPRGEILDRKNKPILTTTGNRGEFSRLLLEPSLSTMVGYNHPFLGQSGLEASLDAYLRGSAGLPTIDIFWNQLFYARPPDGLDIRTTIDLNIQNKFIEIIGENNGAAVLMNAKNGEILAMWSSPSYNTNNIDDEWEELQNDENAPLINRVSQGSYELGNLSSIFQYAYLIENSEEIVVESFAENGMCAYPISLNQKENFKIALINGCGTANQIISEKIEASETSKIIQKFKWDENFDFELPARAIELTIEEPIQQLPSIQLSPLQVARASAAFSNEGFIPYPNMALAVNSPEQGWIIFSTDQPIQIMDRSSANQTAYFFGREDFPAWEITSTNGSNEDPIHWYISGTLPNWQASPMIFALTLENGNSQTAKLLGREIMQQILTNTN